MASPNKIAKTQAEINKNLEKLKRKHLQEQQKRIKPGECLKYIRCVIDTHFLDSRYGSEILTQLNNNNIKYTIQTQKIPKVIFWERSDQQTLLSSTDNLQMTEKFSLEKQVIHIITAEDLLIAIRNKSIKETIQHFVREFPGMILTIIIYGLKNLISAQNKYEIEKVLTEIQIEYNCCNRCHETPAEVAQTIAQFSKAIAEIPFKKQQTEKLNDVDTFLLNDNKDCVRVEGTAGLQRLWQSHLTRLPLVTLEVAETVINEYSNPSKLIQAYNNGTKDEGINLLNDFKIRRTFGPLQANRRLGPELSRKIYTLYNSLDPNDIL